MKQKSLRIQELLANFGIDLVGVADLAGCDFPISEVGESWRRAIVFGYVLSAEVIASITDRPSLLYKHHYKTVNWILDQAAERLAHEIERNGHRAVAVPASQTLGRESHRGHVSHRHLGYLAGLGYIGRSGLLVNPEFGSRVRYCTVLTDWELKTDKPKDDNCGECTLCIDACPAGAIDRSGHNLEKCLAKLNQFAGLPGIGQHICGICVKVCRP